MSISLPRHCIAALALLLLTAGLATAGSATPAHAATRVPSTPAGLPSQIEPLAPYAGETSCDPVIKPGTARLARLLVTTYPGTTFASTYACGTDGTRSEHYDGRAIDWMVSVRNASQRAAATAMISWLLKTDRYGHRFANARRLGVMYVIFNNRMWGSWSGAWEPYNDCAHRPQISSDGYCHRNHVHISLSWNGALGRTSFWTRHLYPNDFGPCRPRDLNWAAPRTHNNAAPCASFAVVRARAGSSPTKVALVTYSGATVHFGSSGPAVSAVQRALRVTATGWFGPLTQRAVQVFQRRHRLTSTGGLNAVTWRALLAAVR